jgi:hypothetical protein
MTPNQELFALLVTVALFAAGAVAVTLACVP